MPGTLIPPSRAGADAYALVRLERQTLSSLRRYGAQVQARMADATAISEPWTNTSAWTGTGTVASSRVYSVGGLTRAAPTSSRWVARTTLHATGASSKFAYFGVGSSTAAADLVGIGQGSASTAAAILRGANVANVGVIPRALPNLAAGDYLCTVAVDETHISLTIQATPAGQTVYGARFPRSAVPGTLNTIFLSANDTVGGGLNWGPMVIYPELQVPPSSVRVIAGTTLFGASDPLVILRADPTTGIGHVISIPGNLDARVPAPMVLFLHQAATGTAFTPWTESRMANVLSAFNGGGYILLSSDNGPATTGGGTQDKYGGRAGLDDYAAAVLWARQHFNTDALMLLGPSQGSFFVQNILAERQIGGVAAVATISGASNLVAMEQDLTYQAALRSVYSASSSADFAGKSAAYNPVLRPGSDFRGVPQRFYVGANDATADPATQITPFVSKLVSVAPEATVTSLAVGHLDDTLYQGSSLVTFFDKYR